jgi:TPR repeat protein
MYDNGYSVSQDYKTAVKWYTLAAEQGVADAQYALGWMYYKEYGVLLDYVYAHMWANISASNGDEDAIKLRDLLANEMMTSADISAAQKLARECVANNYKGC